MTTRRLLLKAHDAADDPQPFPLADLAGRGAGVAHRPGHLAPPTRRGGAARLIGVE